MSVISRREFVIAAGSLAAAAAAPRSLRAMSSPQLLYPPMDLSYFDTPLSPSAAEIRLGYAAITWDGHDAQAMEDIAALGYQGIQLRANAVKEFPDPHALRDKLDEHHLSFAALSSGNVALDSAQQAASLATHEANARYLHAAGGTLLQVIGTFRKQAMFTPDDYRREGEQLTEIAKRASHYGVRTGFHNHMGSIAQTPEELDRVLDAADPQYVKLELDTGHYQQGGGDPAAAVKKYADRLLFLHLKDVRPKPEGGYEFTELGRGTVDFPAVFAALHAVHFRGWGIVELDGPRSGTATPKESAEISRHYLEQRLGVQV